MRRPYHLVAAGLLAAVRAIGLALLGLAIIAGTVRAQGYPERDITIVVSVPPNGMSTRIANALAIGLTRVLSVPVQVVSRPGESGFLGARSVVRAAPDGYTLLLGPSSLFLFDFAALPDAGYVPERDLDTLLMAVRAPYVLVVNPSVPARTLTEFVAYLKARPGTVNFAARWTGAINDLLAAQFWAETGTAGRMTYVADVGAIRAALVDGTISAAFQNVGDIAGDVQTGRLRAIAVTSETRTPLFSEVPTFTEEGLPGLDAFTWQAIAAPVGLPPDVRKRLEDGLRAALLDRSVMASLDALGSEVVATDSRQFARTLRDARRRWRSLLLPTGNTR
ncbi:tripartite tricarboxylate transporter substrate binding protein [Azorhizobium sp. AG788]|uniref:Bug family tripartite tricarboxylate transporter substrate binding protein n=1 Tax=Azorhizobium sp. AG788 TaxID=2183897 RepID=UPI0031390059